MVQVVADVEQGSDVGIGATKNRYAAGRLWVNGEPAWPDQNLEFAAYGAAEPSASKFHGLWRLFRSDWRWPVLAADLVISLTLITLIPLLLAASVYSRRAPAESFSAHQLDKLWSQSRRLRRLRDGDLPARSTVIAAGLPNTVNGAFVFREGFPAELGITFGPSDLTVQTFSRPVVHALDVRVWRQRRAVFPNL